MAKADFYSCLRSTPVLEWSVLVKQTVARFARGNISAQNARILMPDEQAKEHEAARKITQKWAKRVAL